MNRNLALYEAFLSYTKEAILILRPMCEETYSGELPVTVETSWKKTEEDQYERKEIEKPFWAVFVQKAKEILHGLKSYKDLLVEIEKDPVFSLHVDRTIGTQWSQTIVQKDSVVNFALFKLLQKNGCRYSAREAARAIRSLDNYFSDDRIQHEIIWPLCGLKSFYNKLELEPNIQIVRLNQEIIEQLLNLNVQLGMEFRNITHDITNYGLRIVYNSPKVIGNTLGEKYDPNKDDRIKYYRIGQQVIDMLRIAKPGQFLPLGTFHFTGSIMGSLINYRVKQIPRLMGPKGYTIVKGDSLRIKKLWRLINSENIKKRRFLNTALSRFSSAIEKEVDENSFIDFMVSAEALFLNDGQYQGELRYRLTHRIASFLGKKKEDKVRLFKLLKNIYDIRSQILHGGSEKYRFIKKENGDRYTLLEYCELLEQLLRDALTQMLLVAVKSGAPKTIINWDEELF